LSDEPAPPELDAGPERPDGSPGGRRGASLGQKASRAAGWSVLGFGGGQVVRLAGNLILTRLLFPEAFGLMAIAAVLLQGLMLFSDLGIGPSIIQNREGDDRRFLDTAWTMQCARGVLLTAASALAAWPFARFYEDERLFWIVIVVGASGLFQGMNSTKIFTVGRHLNLKQLTLIEFASQVIGVCAMIAWALVSPSYWALAAGGLVTPLSKMTLSHLALEGPINRFRWHRPSAHALFHFGKWIFLSTALSFFAGQSDRLIFAKLIPMEMLGVYSTGAMIALMPITLFGIIERRVVFPVYSAAHREGRDFASIFSRLRAGFLTAGGVICAAFIASGGPLIALLYDARYHEAGWILQLLTVGTWLTILESTYGAAHLATARVRWVAASSFGKVVGIVAFVLLGYQLRGFPGAVLGYSLSEALRYVVLATGGRVMKLPGLGQDFLLTAWIAVTGLGGHALGVFLAGQGFGVAIQTGAVLAAVGAAWLPPAVLTLSPALKLARR
jgi:O-antigen/teichoic acid export membrane protein